MANQYHWHESRNNLVADISSVANISKSIIFKWKQLLIASKGMTVVGSSDAVTAGLDAVDRWTATLDTSKMVRAAAGVAHSWIVLSDAILGHLCLDLSGGSDAAMLNVIRAKTAFTGGTTTARPTSVDEVAGVVSLVMHDSVLTNHRASLLWADEGDFWLIDVKEGSGVEGTTLALVKPYDACSTPVADAHPVCMYHAPSSSGGLGALNFTAGPSGNIYWKAKTGGGTTVKTMAPQLAYIAGGTGYVLQSSAMPASGGAFRHKWPEVPVTLWHDDVTYGDFKGTLADVSYAPHAITAGSVDADPAQRVKLGCLWLPFTVPPLL